MKRNFRELVQDSRVFLQAKQSRFLPNVFVAIILFLGIMFVGEALSVFPGLVVRKFFMFRGANGRALDFTIRMLLIPCGFSILAFFGWVKFVERRPICTMGFEKDNFIRKYIRGFVIGFLMLSICAGIFGIFNLVTIDNSNSSVKGLNALSGIFIVLIGWIVQGASEEVMVRGWLMPVIGARHNAIFGIFVSSIIFGALHLANSNIGVLPMINLILFGIFAAFYVVWEGGLWGICAVHSAWNWAQGNIFGFEVSGIIPAGGILIDLDPIKGNDIITGGPFGVEGGLVCSIVLLTGIVILIMLINKRNFRNLIK
ncbi:CAAX amino terminal protease self- immunity [Clostridium tepidiprofundi DSM 19306]|uniref:CAAX amino terminal protease self-immunity n=1 Tax=Clostridium tepidiprofundi DSM 19306 TaxID=1121338 RepID=A0A151B2R9_9CLOT|nr:type II CAAX endopeptidase family protein [Clostridium tepidiprofundi]KYH34229.1 CAAX amino terminal protease self- immunity [Clostridium tepidiprofundi DSM 19306]